MKLSNETKPEASGIRDATDETAESA